MDKDRSRGQGGQGNGQARNGQQHDSRSSESRGARGVRGGGGHMVGRVGGRKSLPRKGLTKPRGKRKKKERPKLELSDSQWCQIQALLDISRRQMQVIRFMTQGKSPEQMAKALKRKLRTIKTHIERLYRNLDIHDKGGLLEPLMAAVQRLPSSQAECLG